ncbi:hypothetical protein JZ751_022279 [Albula glossodonta]|uniref:Uncharacterized protein n=1 Tax=Albula glossodonta TaxID=121402 RepID=A0A8T2NIX6_9TELE|nr:hypothetical protein JZ751_022279 [Albula glossodonta]
MQMKVKAKTWPWHLNCLLMSANLIGWGGYIQSLHKDTPRQPCLEARGRASLDCLTSILSASSKTPQEVTGVSQRRKGGEECSFMHVGRSRISNEGGKRPIFLCLRQEI